MRNGDHRRTSGALRGGAHDSIGGLGALWSFCCRHLGAENSTRRSARKLTHETVRLERGPGQRADTMSFSAARLTCYAVLSAFETDMRELISDKLTELTIADLPPERVSAAQDRRRKNSLGAARDIGQLLPFMDFGDAFEILTPRSRELPDPVRASVEDLRGSVTKLVGIRNRVAHTRPMEIDDTAIVIDAAKATISRAASDWPVLTETIDRLNADPAHVLRLTIEWPTSPDNAPPHNLPVPDFDETGFFGRQKELRSIRRRIRSYPAISIIGNGGVGKTALALKAAYEILDDPSSNFDAIVWTTAKTTHLTIDDVRRVNDAIESSLGLFASAATTLGGQETDDPLDEVLNYMTGFRVLLILDNLETVLDTRLREFLLDIPEGSRVILTSRVSPGVENQIPLESLERDEAQRLVYALARARGVGRILDMTPETVSWMVDRTECHPTFIKWLVAGIQAGRRPEELIANNAVVLDYCMSNVFDYLGPDPRVILHVLQALPGSKNQQQLAFLAMFDAARTADAVLNLMTTNFVRMSGQALPSSLDTVYELSDFARAYLDKRHPVPTIERTTFRARLDQLRHLGESMGLATRTSPYDELTINVRGAADAHVAKLLRDALLASELPDGLRLCKEAQSLSPLNYECWRVEANLHAKLGDEAAAIEAFDRAAECSDSAQLAYHRGTYLVTQVQDVHTGLQVLQQAARSDPESPEICGQIAWAHFVLGQYEDCVETCHLILRLRGASRTFTTAACDLGLRAASRDIEALTERKDFASAVGRAESLISLLGSATSELLHGEAGDQLLVLDSQLAALSAFQTDDYLRRRCDEFRGQITNLIRDPDVGASGRVIGSIVSLKHEKKFGFARVEGEDYFFHLRDLATGVLWEQLATGQACGFGPRKTSKGWRASELRLLE